MSILSRRLRTSFASLVALPLLATGCGGGGGGGGDDRFPTSATADLVAAVVHLDAGQADARQLVVADAHGRGHAVLTDFLDGETGGVVDDAPPVWSPDRRRLAFSAVEDGGKFRRLFVVDPRRGDPVDVTGAIQGLPEPDVVMSSVRWSPDSRRLLFRAQASGFGASRLVAVDADGTDGVELSAAVPFQITGVLGDGEWAPDGSRIAFIARRPGGGGSVCVTMTADGQGFVDASGTPVPVAGADISGFLWSPDSARLAIRGSLEVAGRVDLYVVFADGSSPRVRVSPVPVVGGGSVPVFEWSPTGARIAYTADVEVATQLDLFTVAPDGTGHVRVNGTTVAGGDVERCLWSPDGSRVAFVGDVAADGVSELFVVPAAGGARTRLSGSIVSGGDVNPLQLTSGPRSPWSPDGARLVYVADAEVDERQDLHLVRVDGTEPARLDVSEGGVLGFEWAPDAVRIAYAMIAPVSVRNVFIADVRVPADPPAEAAGGTGAADAARNLEGFTVDGGVLLFTESSGPLVGLRGVPATGGAAHDVIAPVGEVIYVAVR